MAGGVDFLSGCTRWLESTWRGISETLCRFASTCSLLAVVMESECGILVFVSGNHGMEVMCIGADLGMRGGSPLY